MNSGMIDTAKVFPKAKKVLFVIILCHAICGQHYATATPTVRPLNITAYPPDQTIQYLKSHKTCGFELVFQYC